jgi:hypothetical protein
VRGIAERLAHTLERLGQASEEALSSSTDRSVRYLGEAAAVRRLSTDLASGHTPNSEAVRALSRSVWLLADCAPRDSREQSAADGATLTLAGIAEELEEAEHSEWMGPEQPLTAEDRYALGLEEAL